MNSLTKCILTSRGYNILKIGLTGGIGSGKSTVADLFKDLGAPVIDADVLAHQLVQKGQPALLEIKKQFSPAIINDQGSLNRPLLREIIFSNAEKKKQLEAIIHPRVFAEMQNQITDHHSPYIMLVIPLLFETQKEHFVDRVLVVDCSSELQIKRASSRDQLSAQHIQCVINAQTPRQHRLQVADDIINNSKNLATLAEQVKKLHNHYISLQSC